MSEKKYLIDNPTLMAEWDWEKNNELGLDPRSLTLGNEKKAWWTCDKGHEWQARIGHRSSGVNCPYCSNRKVLIGYNDLVTQKPYLAEEWNYGKNGDLKPENFTTGSSKKVWWICYKGHEWQAKIGHRSSGSKCPICSSERNTSFPEYAIEYYLKKCGLTTFHSYKENGYELDIYIPSKKTAIEYDGYFYHKTKAKKDLEKNSKCAHDGIKLYRLREGLPLLNDSSIDYFIYVNQSNISEVIQKIIIEIVGINLDVNVKRDAIAIENLRERTEKENSIISLNPQLASEWNYEKNGDLKPENFTIGSSKKVWWKCNKGHEWQATIVKRNNGSACPYCSGVRRLVGYNDLASVNPELASEWNYEKNGNATPENYVVSSLKKVWWKCSKGHEWKATIASRNAGHGCPCCDGQRVIKGYNDITTLNPRLAKEWNYEKNGNLTPEDFMVGSSKKVWWKCNKGHEW